jgi:hypothetical protein
MMLNYLSLYGETLDIPVRLGSRAFTGSLPEKEKKTMLTRMFRLAAAAALFVVAVAVFTLSAQDKKAPDFTIGKKGEVHLNVTVRAGGTLLKPGMYQIQHELEGTDHVVVFKEMDMPAGYRHGNTPVAEQASARMKCNIEAVDKKVRNNTITLRTNAAGEKEIADVQIAGEGFKHLF